MQTIALWMEAELERIESEYPPVPGLDGSAVIARKAVFAEYNKRLAALKLKYPDTTAVEKARTFGQLIHSVG